MKLPKSLADILTLVTKPTPMRSAAELRATLESPLLDVPALDRHLEDLDNQRRQILLRGTDVEFAEHEAKIRTAELAAQRAAAAREELERLIVEAEAREAEAERAAHVAEAKRLTAVAVAKIERDLPPAFGMVRAVIRAMAEAQLAVDAANAGRPTAQHLAGPEDLRNAGRHRYAVELERRTVDLWVWPASGQPLSEEQARYVIAGRDGSGVLPAGQGRPMAPGAGVHNATVVKHPFIQVTKLPAESADSVAPLARLALPPIKAGDPPNSPEIGRYADEPADVLTALDQLEAQLAARQVDSRKPVTTFEPIPDRHASEAA